MIEIRFRNFSDHFEGIGSRLISEIKNFVAVQYLDEDILGRRVLSALEECSLSKNVLDYGMVTKGDKRLCYDKCLLNQI